MPKSLVDRIEKASTFNEGFSTTEFLSSALVDMKLHTSDQDNIDPDKFEKDMLKELNMPSEIVMRHRTPQFAHIFSSDAYSADTSATDGLMLLQQMHSLHSPE
ncbi:MAG: hypothetical protein IPN88_18580 [Bacteroidetes bacterium]|nr:hypothetical protein [Bacteroidota bacterium]